MSIKAQLGRRVFFQKLNQAILNKPLMKQIAGLFCFDAQESGLHGTTVLQGNPQRAHLPVHVFNLRAGKQLLHKIPPQPAPRFFQPLALLQAHEIVFHVLLAHAEGVFHRFHNGVVILAFQDILHVPVPRHLIHILKIAESGQEHRFTAGPVFLDMSKQCNAVHPRHPDIRQHHIKAHL